MSLEEKRLTIKFFLTVLGLLMTIWFTAYGYTWVRLGAIEVRNEKTQTENADIKTQLSQIQADLSWIKYNLQK